MNSGNSNPSFVMFQFLEPISVRFRAYSYFPLMVSEITIKKTIKRLICLTVVEANLIPLTPTGRSVFFTGYFVIYLKSTAPVL